MSKEKIIAFFKSGLVSILTAFAFCVYNTAIGIEKAYPFAISIAVYYLFIVAIRISVYVAGKKDLSAEQERKWKIATEAALLSVDLILIAPITMLVFHKKAYSMGLVFAIANATYCVYKITAAIIHYRKSAKNTSVKSVCDALNLVDALVSILSLQNALLIAQGSQNDDDMRILTFCTSAALFLIIIAVSIKTLACAIKTKQPAND